MVKVWISTRVTMAPILYIVVAAAAVAVVVIIILTSLEVSNR